MNIVIVNHYAGGPQFGMEFRPYYLAREWKKNGHKVLIVGASFSHLRSSQPDVNAPLEYKNVEGIDYLWIKTNIYSGNGLGRIVSMFLFTYRLYTILGKELGRFAPDLLIASSTYPLDNFSVKILAEKFKAKYCYEVHDLWPLSPMELGGYSQYHPFILAMQYAENFAYKHSDFVVSILPNTLAHMIEHGLPKEKFCYVPNGIVLEEWEGELMEHDHHTFFEQLKKEGKTIVGYLGGHAISNALEMLLEVASLTNKNNPGVAFVLVGGGAEKQYLIDQADILGLSNIFFLAPVLKNQVPSILNGMDILYLGWHSNPLYRFGISPNKLLDYMMAGKPIVHSVDAANDLVAESGCGISVKPENPEAIVNAILKIEMMNESERIAMGKKGRDFVIKHHSYDVLAEKFLTFAAV